MHLCTMIIHIGLEIHVIPPTGSRDPTPDGMTDGPNDGHAADGQHQTNIPFPMFGSAEDNKTPWSSTSQRQMCIRINETE